MSEKKELDILRHSCAHLMAAAVFEIFPEAKFGIGSPIDNGFYYDFDLPKTLTPQDLTLIEKKMKELGKNDLRFERIEVSKEKAIKIIRKMGQPYKLELLKELPERNVSFYQTGKFFDLCRGPHLKSTGEIKHFKLLSVSGAYWRGDSNRPMLQRIYGTCWQTKEELAKYLKNLEEAKNRDHRKLGLAMDLYSFHPEAPGMVFWHPKGKIIFDKLIDFSREKLRRFGYQEILTPNILDVNVWKISGHWKHYKNAMYFVGGEGSNIRYGIRPMGCPGAIILYKSINRSYKELPIRFAEFDTIVRKELSGTLHGLLRVQQLTQDDAHIFLREDQILEEVSSLLKLIDETYKTLGLSYKIKLSTRPSDFMGKIETWNKAEGDLKRALQKNNQKYEIKEGEGAFYGPKIDFDILDALGRAWQCATIQLDFQMPEKFDLKYIDEKGKPQRPVIIHRVILGSIERFIGILIEHYGGKLPIWLAPVQVKVLPVSDKHLSYANKVFCELRNQGLRVGFDERNESVSKKIRDAEIEKVPYIVVVGDREKNTNSIAVRNRDTKKIKIQSIDDFIKEIVKFKKIVCRNCEAEKV